MCIDTAVLLINKDKIAYIDRQIAEILIVYIEYIFYWGLFFFETESLLCMVVSSLIWKAVDSFTLTLILMLHLTAFAILRYI